MLILKNLAQSRIIAEISDLAASKRKNLIRILHVDDDLCLLEVSKQILSMENNFDIDNVTSVDEAIRKMEKKSYDAVISDYEMPQKHGLDFLKELREKNNQVPFILLTGKGREDVAVKALNLGADSYINKNGSTETVYCELADAINKTVERKKSRELLAKSESKYHALVENSLQGISILISDPIRIVFANGAFGRILGYSSEELTSLSPQGIVGLIYPEDRAGFFKRMEDRLKGEPAEVRFEFRAVRKDGSFIWLSSLANRVDYDGQPAVQGMFLDINESKKAAEVLRESEHRYRELANCLPDIVFETDLNGQLEFANERASEISGYSLNEVERGVNIFQFIVPEDRDRAIKSIQRLLSGESYVPAEYKFMRKDGTTFPALITATTRVCKNKVTGFRGIVLDISERKKAEDELRQSQELTQKVFDCSPNLIYIYDLMENSMVYANRVVFEFLGYTPEQIKSMGSELFANIFHPDDSKVLVEHHARFVNVSDNVVYDVEFRMKHSSGEWRWLHSRDVLFNRTQEGLGKQILGSAQDITGRRRAEEKVRFEAERLERVMENSQDLIMLSKPDGIVVYVNSALRKITGYSETEFVGKNPWIVHPDDSDRAKEVFGCNLKGENVEFEHRIITKDGQTKWVIHSCLPIMREGKVSELVSTVRDITERKKNQDMLRKKEQELEVILDSSPTIVFYKDLKGKFIQVNKAFAQALNKTKQSLVGKTVFDIYSGKIAQEMTDDDHLVLVSKVPKLNIVEPYESATGLRWIRTHKIPTFDEEGEVTGLIGFSEEITDYRKVETELKESLNNYYSLINGMSDAVWVVDFSGNFVDVNDAAVKVLGYSKDELLSLGIKDVDKCLTPEQVNSIISRIVLVGVQSFETVHTAKDGKEIPVEINSSLITYNGKQAVLGIARNITERKRAEQDLEESEEKYRTLFEQAGDYTFILEAQLTGVPIIFDANVSALQIHGYTREELIGKPITFLDVGSKDSILSRSIKLLNNEKLMFEAKHRCKDGSIIDVEVSIKKVKVGLKNLLVSVERDVTERMKNEVVLRQERGMLESVTKNIGAGIVMISKDYKILWMNDFLRQFTGASENNHCYSSFNTCTTICPDCGPKKIFEGADFDRREYCNQTEFNKDHPVWFELIATPIKDADGNVVAALELTVNITEKKIAEQKLKETGKKIELMNEKLRVVGGLTRHDVGNKLSTVTGYAYLLKKKHADMADVVEGLGSMEQAVKDSMKIFDFAKMYEQLGAEELVLVDVEAKLNEAKALFSGSLPKIINDCHGLTVLADSFLRQMFYNLIDNTRKYGKKTSIIKVHYKKTETGNLELIYEDDGVGISAENKLKLFSEGFSTGGSTGFGLFLTKKMMDVYGWQIHETGEPGKGAKFVITIPKGN